MWQPLSNKLPVVPVHDLAVTNGDLAAATHGRSFWILDNVELLHQVDAQALGDAVHLFQPRPTIRFRNGANLAARSTAPSTENPPSGVVIPYYFRQRPPTM